jgi:hypothetical protein
MLEPWIIDEIKRREQLLEERPQLELPVPEYRPPAEKPKTGTVVIQL